MFLHFFGEKPGIMKDINYISTGVAGGSSVCELTWTFDDLYNVTLIYFIC